MACGGYQEEMVLYLRANVLIQSQPQTSLSVCVCVCVCVCVWVCVFLVCVLCGGGVVCVVCVCVCSCVFHWVGRWVVDWEWSKLQSAGERSEKEAAQAVDSVCEKG